MVTGLHKKWFRLINKSKGSLSIKARLTYLNLLQHRFLAKEYHRCLRVNCQPFTRKTCHNLKWFLIQCRKTKSKVLMTQANQKGYRQSGEPINSNELIKSLRNTCFALRITLKSKQMLGSITKLLFDETPLAPPPSSLLSRRNVNRTPVSDENGA